MTIGKAEDVEALFGNAVHAAELVDRVVTNAATDPYFGPLVDQLVRGDRGAS